MIAATHGHNLPRPQACVSRQAATLARDSDGQPHPRPHSPLPSGLRLKAGCDLGRVTAAVNPTTGRMDYRGRAMNKAARVASKAASGQVSEGRMTG